MPPTPSETTRKLRQHDNDIAEIYAKLTSIEQKADVFRSELITRFDRLEARAQRGDSHLTVMGSSLAEVGEHLDRIDGGLGSLTGHLSGIDAKLAEIDAAFVEILRRLPEAG